MATKPTCSIDFTTRGRMPSRMMQANVNTNGYQLNSRVGMSGAGDFVIAWEGPGEDTGGLPGYHGEGIFGRRFDSAGSALSPEFQVNKQTVELQTSHDVAVSHDGRCFVVWLSTSQFGGDLVVHKNDYADPVRLADDIAYGILVSNAGYATATGVTLRGGPEEYEFRYAGFWLHFGEHR